MEDRLLQLIKAEGINPTRLAERIGVQRSSISHILSGRNKPSYDFLLKILESFPNLNPDWLMRGKGLMYKGDIPQQPSLFDHFPAKAEESAKQVNAAPPEIREILGQIPQAPKELNTPAPEHSHRKIVKVLMFYSDMTFTEFIPEN